MNVLRAARPAAACCLALALAAVTASATDAPSSASKVDVTPPPALPMTAEQIVEHSIEVRGGLAAWKKINTIIWAGHLETTHSPIPSLPFKLEQKRPNKSRFEINEPSQRSVRVFDGMMGWKMRTGEDGRPDVKRFTAQEAKFAREAPGLEGPLIDYRARGGSVRLEGNDEIEGHKMYRIALRLASGETQRIWIDTDTFLEARYDRPVQGPHGSVGVVSIRYRDYKEVQGLALPSIIEIGPDKGGKPDRMLIERVALNPDIDDREFGGLGESRTGTPAK